MGPRFWASQSRNLETQGGAVSVFKERNSKSVELHLKRLQWREKVRAIPQDLQTTAEQKSEWHRGPLGEKSQSSAAKEGAARKAPKPQAAVSATCGPLRHSRTLPIKNAQGDSEASFSHSTNFKFHSATC